MREIQDDDQDSNKSNIGYLGISRETLPFLHIVIPR